MNFKAWVLFLNFFSYIIKWYSFGKIEAPEDGIVMFETYSVSTEKITYWNNIQGFVLRLLIKLF